MPDRDVDERRVPTIHVARLMARKRDILGAYSLATLVIVNIVVIVHYETSVLSNKDAHASLTEIDSTDKSSSTQRQSVPQDTEDLLAKLIQVLSFEFIPNLSSNDDPDDPR